MAGYDGSGVQGPPEASAPQMVQVPLPKLMQLIAKFAGGGQGQGMGGLAPQGAPPPQDAPEQMPQQQGPPMPPGAGQQALMSRGQPPQQGGAMQPRSGAMPFMGGGGGADSGQMGALASAQPQLRGGGGGQQYQTTRATVPNMPSPPTIDDALGDVEKIAGAGGFRFGPGSGLDSRGPAIMQALAARQAAYKDQVASQLGLYGENVSQANNLNQQSTNVMGRQERAHDRQFDQAMGLAQLGLQREKNEGELAFKQALTGIVPGGSSSGSAPSSGASPNVEAQAKAFLEGRAPYPSSAMLSRNPVMRQAFQLAQQMDPNYDMNTSKSRLKMQSELASTRPNTIGGSIVSYNTVQQHLANAAQAVANLDNSEFGRLPNKAANALPNVVNPTRQKALSSFNIAKQNVATEIEKMIKSGVPDVEGLKSRMEQINPDDPPSVQMNALRELQNTVAARQQNLEEAFRQTMGEQGVSAWEAKNKRPFSFTSPESKKAQDYTSKINDWVSGGKQGPAPSLEGGGDGAAPPKPGTVQKGYRFRGGDPAKQSSWEKIQ